MVNLPGAFCRHHGACGGCDFQATEYAAQLEYKTTYCRNLLAFTGCVPDPLVPSPFERFFRNKMEFVVAGESAAPRIGQREKERYDSVVDIAECPVADERVPALLDIVRSWLRETATAPYDLRSGSGELRYVCFRLGKDPSSVMVTLASALGEAQAPAARARYSLLAGRLCAVEGVRSVYLCLNSSVSDTAVNGTLLLLAGNDHIRERVNGVEYIIRPQTFFQTNPACCARLYDAVAGCCAGIEGRIYDVYCGSGGITLQLAKAGRAVTGIDISRRNIEDAAENAKANGLAADFICRDADEFIRELGDPGGAWGMIVDPPRNGLSGRSIKTLNVSGPGRCVYVSCNPLKMREDLKKLDAYAVTRIVPVDMFPHTRHMEVVALLDRRNAGK